MKDESSQPYQICKNNLHVVWTELTKKAKAGSLLPLLMETSLGHHILTALEAVWPSFR